MKSRGDRRSRTIWRRGERLFCPVWRRLHTCANLQAPLTPPGAAIGPLMRASIVIKKRLGAIDKRVGALLIATGVAFLTGGFQSASIWLIETFLQFGQVG